MAWQSFQAKVLIPTTVTGGTDYVQAAVREASTASVVETIFQV